MSAVKTGRTNPAQNQLPSGATEEKLVEAVNISGYPLQSRVGAVVTNFMRTSANGAPAPFAEEWSYLDRTEDTLRTLDIRAGLEDKPFDERGRQRRVTAALDLLIECKRTRAVTVFGRAAAAAPFA